MVRLIFLAVPALDVLWMVWAWWRTGRFRHKAWWRAFISLFFILMITHFVWVSLFRSGSLGAGPPTVTLGIAYIWHLLVIPVLSAIILFAEATITGRKLFKSLILRSEKARSLQNPRETHEPEAQGVSRRHFLAMSAVAVPPVITAVAGIGGYAQSRGFRVRRLEVDLPTLPPELDGITIAHLSDVHVGKFTDEKVLARIIDATNALKADLILSPGDLIDFSLADLPAAVDAMRKLDAPGGVFLCEGNHDLFESRERFEATVKAGGLGLLINETANVRLRGRDLQIHGLRWGAKGMPRGHTDDAGARQNLALVEKNVNPEAFPIVLAHHPHAFDAAREAGLPLTLCGHTHGGQLMLSDTIGAGPLMFRYWSGLYRRDASRLVVSNGAGNWLPLRINAPAEIIHLTLRAMAVA